MESATQIPPRPAATSFEKRATASLPANCLFEFAKDTSLSIRNLQEEVVSC
jgi:hypothetical protein